MRRVAVLAAVLASLLAIPATASAASISGTVTVDPGGAPLQDVCVTAWDSSLPYEQWPPAAEATTDALGAYTLTPASGSYIIKFKHCPTLSEPAYATEYYDNAIRWWDAEAVVVDDTHPGAADAALKPGHVISGTVTNSEASGIGNVCVQAFRSDTMSQVGPTTSTDGGGHYALDPLPNGSYRVQFWDCSSPPTYVGRWYNQQPTWETATNIVLTANRNDIHATLDPGYTISGYVTTGAPDWTPIGGICVSVWPTNGQPSFGGGQSRGEDGYYITPPVPAGAYKLQFSDCNTVRRYLTEWWQDKPTFNEAAILTLAGNMTDISPTLTEGRTITGHVTNGSADLAGICVDVFNAADPPWSPWLTSVTTDSGGTFTAGPLQADRSYKLQFRDCNTVPGYVSEWWKNQTDSSTATAVPVGAENVTLSEDAVLAAGYTISGHVVDEGGLAVQNVCVWVNDAAQPWMSVPDGNTNTDAYGNFRTNPLPAGNYKLQFRDCVVAPARYVVGWWANAADFSSAATVSLVDRSETLVGNQVLHPGFTIQGYVKNAGGSPLAGICVWAFDASKPQGTPSIGNANTDADGHYMTEPVPAGSYQIMFRDCNASPRYISEWYDDQPDQSQAASVPVNDNTTLNEVRLASGFTISGDVTGDGGAPLQNICVFANSGEEGSPPVSWGNTDQNGHYVMAPMPAGTYTVQFNDCRQPPSYISAQYPETVTLTNGDRGGVNVQLQLGHVITGRVTDGAVPDPNPIPGACVGAWTEASGGQDTPAAWTNTDGTGHYRLGPLPAGNYYVRFGDCQPPNEWFWEWYNDAQTIEGATLVPAAEDPTLADAVLERGYTISGHVTNPQDAGIANVCVDVHDGTGGPEDPPVGWGRTDSGGDYTAGPLRDGTYRLEFSDCSDDPGYVGAWYGGQRFEDATDVPVSGGSVDGKDIELAVGYTISGRITSDLLPHAPIAGVCIGGSAADNQEAEFWGGETDANGDYRTQPLLPGTYKVRFNDCNGHAHVGEWYRASTGGTEDWQLADQIDLTQGDATGIDAGLEPGFTISGTVTSELAGHPPIENVCVGVSDADNGDHWYDGGSTGADGTYESEALRPGDYKVQFSDCNDPATYAREFYDGAQGADDWQSALRITITNADVPLIDTVLEVGHRIAGTITSDAPGHAPIENACVGVTRADNPDVWWDGGWTGTDGVYRSEPLRDGGYKVRFGDCSGSPGYVPEWYDGVDGNDWEQATTVTVAGADVEINAGLAVGHVVSGRVTDAHGAGIGGICIGLVEAGDPDAWVRGADTQDDGSYVIEPVAPGQYKLQFSDCHEQALYVSEWFDDVTSSFEDATVVDLRTQNQTADAELARGGGITGTVRAGSGGGPLLGDICVDASRSDGPGEGGAMTAADGTYRVGGLPSGHYTVSFSDCRSDQTGGIYHPQQVEDVVVTAPGDTPGVNANMGAPDNTWPDTFITSGPTGVTDRTSAAFTFASDDPEATFQCSLDHADWADCESPQSVSGLADGMHNFSVRAIDPVGHVDAVDPASHNWAIDTVEPLTTHGYGGVLPDGGGTVTSDPQGTGATAADPLKTAVTAPAGGTVDILEGPAEGSPPAGYSFFGSQVQITTDVVASPSSPLRIAFTLDASLIPAGTPATAIQAFRDGVRVLDCTGAPSAVPDPCVLSREALAGGDVRVTVLTSQASTWTLGISSVAAVPGKPVGDRAITTGALTVTWSAAAGASTYTLAYHDADDSGWTQVAAGLTSPSYAYPTVAPEGTLTFRVKAVGTGGESGWSAESAPVTVDRSAPAAPAASTDRAPADSGWFRDTVTVSFAAAGDPAPDGQGSGVDPGSLPAAQTFTTTGEHSVTGTVRDRAGNTSAASTIAVKVDADAPQTAISCPASVGLGATATAHWTATDSGSGLAGAAAGDVALDSATAGPHTASAPAAADRAGHTTAGATCGYTVLAGTVLPSPTVKIATTKVTATKKGDVALKLTCAKATCTGTLTLKATVKVGGRKRTVKLGTKTFSIPAGASRTVKLRLSKANLKLLKRLKKVRATAAAQLTGATRPQATATVTIKAPKA